MSDGSKDTKKWEADSPAGGDFGWSVAGGLPGDDPVFLHSCLARQYGNE